MDSLIETSPSYRLLIIIISTGSERNLYEYFSTKKSTLKL